MDGVSAICAAYSSLSTRGRDEADTEEGLVERLMALHGRADVAHRKELAQKMNLKLIRRHQGSALGSLASGDLSLRARQR